MFTFVFELFKKSGPLPIEKMPGQLLLLVLLVRHFSTNIGARDGAGTGREENQRG